MRDLARQNVTPQIFALNVAAPPNVIPQIYAMNIATHQNATPQIFALNVATPPNVIPRLDRGISLWKTIDNPKCVWSIKKSET